MQDYLTFVSTPQCRDTQLCIGKKGLLHHNPSRPSPGRREKIKLNFYFRTSLWCLIRFYEDLKGLIKPFEAPQRSVKAKFNSIFISVQLSEMQGTGRVK